ncbi:MAG TPA: outer membrane lipoprotein carrier protein LolA [Acidobacteriota bacterium]|nr:outer membrane lipoprotein carrier protein LolA [Acidobacteriota bacterium]
MNTGCIGCVTPSFSKACQTILFLCLALSAFGQQGKEDRELQQILNKMDEVAKSFRTFKATFTQKNFTAVLKEFSAPESGEFYYARSKDGSVFMRHEIMNPGKRILTIKGDTLTVYRPAIKEAQIASREKMRDIVEYLALGIGQSSAKLREKFKISYKGTDSIDNAKCAVLVFVPKDAKTAARVASITIWLKESTATPAQYKFEEPSDDYLLIRFSAEKINTGIPDSKFEQNIPADVEKQRL